MPCQQRVGDGGKSHQLVQVDAAVLQVASLAIGIWSKTFE